MGQIKMRNSNKDKDKDNNYDDDDDNNNVSLATSHRDNKEFHQQQQQSCLISTLNVIGYHKLLTIISACSLAPIVRLTS